MGQYLQRPAGSVQQFQILVCISVVVQPGGRFAAAWFPAEPALPYRPGPAAGEPRRHADDVDQRGELRRAHRQLATNRHRQPHRAVLDARLRHSRPNSVPQPGPIRYRIQNRRQSAVHQPDVAADLYEHRGYRRRSSRLLQPSPGIPADDRAERFINPGCLQ